MGNNQSFGIILLIIHTVLFIFERLILMMRMNNVDRDGRHPLRRARQSSKVPTLIVNLVSVEDRESDRKDKLVRYFPREF